MIPEAREVHLSRKDRKVLEACCRSPVTLQRDLNGHGLFFWRRPGVAPDRSPRKLGSSRGLSAFGGIALPTLALKDRKANGGRASSRSIRSRPTNGFRSCSINRRLRGSRAGPGPLLAGELGDVDVQYVWRFLRSHKIDLAARKAWCESNDSHFTAKAADVVGLYVAPTEKAIVLCVDEKPSIQALERAQGYLKLPNGRALTGQGHDYKRHGTTTLFAALEVATGKIIATHSKRRRRVEFLDFMNSVTAAFPNRQLHVIFDNLNTHKKNEDWLKAHPNVKFHFTPTSAFWLNQVEVWFSILQGQSLSGASFTTLKQLEQHIDAYIKAYNVRAEPFVWTKKKVRQRR
jgi:hypothetical protein